LPGLDVAILEHDSGIAEHEVNGAGNVTVTVELSI
jgi:hypothetical protein